MIMMITDTRTSGIVGDLKSLLLLLVKVLTKLVHLSLHRENFILHFLILRLDGYDPAESTTQDYKFLK